MSDKEIGEVVTKVARAMPPLEVLAAQIQAKPYAEMSLPFQRELVASVKALRSEKIKLTEH